MSILDGANWQRVKEHVAADEDRALALLREIVALPTVAHPTEHTPALDECAELLVRWLQERGSTDARVITGYSHPLVLGRIEDDPSKPTMLVYAHFDVQGVEPLEAWHSPPFEMDIRDGRIFGRGTGDNKGQFLAHLLAIDAYRACGLELPVNILFLGDGAEEIGSPSLEPFAADHPELLQADLAFTSDGPQHQAGLPTLVLGSRGLVAFHIRVRTLRRSGHSAYSPILPGAGFRAMEIVQGLRDADGRITIPGFYDDVIEPTKADLDLLRAIPPMDHDVIAEFEPNPPLPDLGDEEFYYRLLMAPSLNIPGLAVGDLTGHVSAVPNEALIKLEVGTVPGQRAEVVEAQVREYLAGFGIADDDIEVVGAIDPSRTPPDHPLVAPMARALQRAWDTQPVVMNRFSSYAPYSVFDRLGLPGFYMAYANPDEANHAPNENLMLTHFRQGILTSIAVYDEVARHFAREG